jgi:hypothetical protein
MGDMNIDFFKYNEHIQTEEYLDMLFTNSYLPIISGVASGPHAYVMPSRTKNFPKFPYY